MRLVVDANILFSALIADGTTRALLIELDHSYYAPSFIHTETHNHRETIRDKAGLTDSELDVVLDALFDEIVFVSDSDLAAQMQAAHAAIGEEDPDDVPYLAAALVKQAAIWSDDPVFEDYATVDTYTTTEMVETFGIP